MSVQYKFMMVRNQRLTSNTRIRNLYTIHFERLYKKKADPSGCIILHIKFSIDHQDQQLNRITMKMNKLILLATFLAVVVSVSHAMPNMELEDEDNDDETQALIQNMEIARSAGSTAKTQWRVRIRIPRIRIPRIRIPPVRIRIPSIVRKVCKFVPAVCSIIPLKKANIETENQIANSEGVCTAAKTVCSIVG